MNNNQYPIIENPLEWQKEIENSPFPLNMRGSVRFWETCAEMGLIEVYRDGAPEFSTIVFKLNDKVGIKLSTTEDNPHIDFGFVDLDNFK